MSDSALRRYRRYSETPKLGDNRNIFRRDRDRILYSSAFKRLSDVTQVVSADNAHVFHNRLTHSLQVAQVGQSIAEEFLRSQKDLAEDCVDVDVVAAACLGHDLGHPPFGHTAEDELREIANHAGLGDRFEGNAQSFRIVTKLAFRSLQHPGLNLTCATLAALLKYPWLRSEEGPHSEKWGSYDSEREDFDQACNLLPSANARTAEAEIMDWSDDITYAVHDMEDFYRAGRMPLHLLSNRKEDRERRRFYDEVFARRKNHAGVWAKYSPEELKTAFENLIVLFPDQPYDGTQEHRANLRKFTGQCINNFIGAIRLQASTLQRPRLVEIEPQYEQQVTMLKELTWHYIINAPALATQQHGQRKMIRELFDCLFTAARKRNVRLFPRYYQQKITASASETDLARLVIDLISGMTERQCVDHFQTLTGISINPSFETVL